MLIRLTCCALLLGACSSDSTEADPIDATSPPADGVASDAASPDDASAGVDDGASETQDVDDSPDSEPDLGPELPPAVTWFEHVQPIVTQRCGGCHTAGSVAPFELDTLESAQAMMSLGLVSIANGEMPPWPPEPTCRPLQNARIITSDEVETLTEWVALGTPAGNMEDAPPQSAPPAAARLPEPTHSAYLPEPYLPPDAANDDYRCFILDFDFESDQYLKAAWVEPDRTELVHHVLVYAIEPNMVAAVEAADADDDGPGYTCFGAPFAGAESLADGGISKLGDIADGKFGLPQTIGAWVPGHVPVPLQDDVGKRIDAGSRVVMQLHYNMLSSEAAADNTRFAMVLTDVEPSILTRTTPLPILRMKVEEADPEGVVTREFTNYNDHPLRVVGAAGHMHLLGIKFKAELVTTNGDECLLDIPAWDFDWQQFYAFEADDEVILEPGDAIRVTCTYDNSAANQPFVNGEQLEPQDVTWGEGTLDEMCLLYLDFARPFTPSKPKDGAACSQATDCIANCEPPSLDCIFACQDADLQCNGCTIDSLFGCGLPCATTAVPLVNCFIDCMLDTAVLGGRLASCLNKNCGPDYDTMLECMDPRVQDGSCDKALKTCGVVFP